MNLKRDTLWSLMPILLTSVISIVSVPLYYKYLGAQMYALWFYVQTFTGAFGFMDLGIGVAVGRYIGIALGRDDLQAAREYWATGNAIALPLVAVMSGAFVLLGVLFGPEWFQAPPEKVALLRWCFVAGGVGLFFAYYGQMWLVLGQAFLDFRALSILRTVITIGSMGASILIAVLTGNPFFIICATAGLGALNLLVLVARANQRYTVSLDFRQARLSRLREMSVYTAKTFGHLLAGSFLGSIDRLVLGRLAPATQFAGYNVALNFGNRIQGLSVAVMGPVFHSTSRALGRGHKQRAAAIYNETFQLLFGWYLLGALWVIVWHRPVLSLWLGVETAATVGQAFPWVVAGCCITAVANISGAQLGPMNRVGTAIMFQTFTNVLLGVCVYVGWRLGGLAGAGIGFLVSRVGTLTQDVYVIRILGGGGWLAIGTWRQILAQGAVAGCFYAVSLAFQQRAWLISLAVLHGVAVALFLVWRHYMEARVPDAAVVSSDSGSVEAHGS